jgi:hypothetical protein
VAVDEVQKPPIFKNNPKITKDGWDERGGALMRAVFTSNGMSSRVHSFSQGCCGVKDLKSK